MNHKLQFNLQSIGENQTGYLADCSSLVSLIETTSQMTIAPAPVVYFKLSYF